MGTGQEDPERFNPTRLDARGVGFACSRKRASKVGFFGWSGTTMALSLYPTAHTDYLVKASPYGGMERRFAPEVSQAAARV